MKVRSPGPDVKKSSSQELLGAWLGYFRCRFVNTFGFFRDDLFLPFLICLMIGLTVVNSGFAEGVSISNGTISATYDEVSGTFSLTEKASGLVFLKGGKLDGVVKGRAVVEPVKDAVFKSGKRLKLKRADGGVATLEIYPDLPFVLIRGQLYNRGPSPIEVTNILPATFKVDLGKRSPELRTLGTAGLTAPDQNPGSYLFLTLADPSTRRGVVSGWLTADRGSGVLFSEVSADAVRFKTRIDYGRLRLDPGESAQLEVLAIGLFDDARIGQELFARAIARQYRIRLRPEPAGYCTWYSKPYGGAADEKSIGELAEFAVRELKPFGLSFIQIDDKWQDGQERNGPARRFWRAKPDGPYPHGMKVVAERFRQLGLTAGLWFLPFASDYRDPEFKYRQHWFVHRLDGQPFETPWGNTSLDLTRPEVQEYLANLVRTIHGWGYNYFKMDGLWTGTATEQIYVNDGYRDDHIGDNAPFHDPHKTNLESLRDGLKLLRRAAGPAVFFSGCNVSQNMRTLGGCLGLVDSMRIGPDNGPHWADYEQEIARNGSGSLITGPIRGTRLYFLNGRVWWNDPDPCYVRESIPIQQARLLASWVALSGQVYLNSDWIPGLPSERLDIIRRTIPPHSAIARPIDYFDSSLPCLWLVSDTRPGWRRDVLGLFNWESQARSVACTAAKAGLEADKTYFAFDFWANVPLSPFCGELNFDVPAQSCRAIALRAAAGHPVLVSTSRHVTQGMIDVTAEKWSPLNKTLSGTSAVVAGDPYEIRIAGLTDNQQSWKLVSAAVSRADQAAGVIIAPNPLAGNEPGWLRVRFHSQRSLSVKWILKFTTTPNS